MKNKESKNEECKMHKEFNSVALGSFVPCQIHMRWVFADR